MKSLSFQPVILGTDIGAYALARSFHEEWGVHSTVITAQELGPIQHAGIIDLRLIDPSNLPNPQTATPLIDGTLLIGEDLKKQYPGKTLLLIANMDANVTDIMKREAEFREHYAFLFPSLKLIEDTSNKALFPKLAKQYGLTVPETVELDLSAGTSDAEKRLAEFDNPFPWIIKPATSSTYERLKWEGKAKVYTISSREEARALVRSLYAHTRGHEGASRFVLQPRVEGNDTFNLSVTAYVDSHGKVTMLGSAQVLLEDHSPTALGNPVSMITEPYPKLYDQVSKFLEGVGWHGFANFDFKVDARDGFPYCFEVNPRIGRNSYYNTAAGMNPMKFFVDDVIFGKNVPQKRIGRTMLYSILPKQLLLRYLDPELQRKVRALYRAKRHHDPMYYSAEFDGSARGWKRLGYVTAAHVNHWRKYHRFYPVSTFKEGITRSLDTSHLRPAPRR